MSVQANFTAPDNTDLAAYLCDTGEAWTVHSGVASIQNNALQARSGILRATVEGETHGTLSLTCGSLGLVAPPNIGLMWRYVDADNYWYSGSSGSAGSQYEVHKIIAGVDTTVLSAGSAPQAGDVLQVRFTRAGWEFAVNGVRLGGGASEELQDAGLVGLFMPSGLGGSSGPKVDAFGFGDPPEKPRGVGRTERPRGSGRATAPRGRGKASGVRGSGREW